MFAGCYLIRIKTMENNIETHSDERKSWRPYLEEVLIPFIGTSEYFWRGVKYWPKREDGLHMSKTEISESARQNLLFTNSEQLLIWRKFNYISSFLIAKDVAITFGTIGGGFALVNLLTK